MITTVINNINDQDDTDDTYDYIESLKGTYVVDIPKKVIFTMPIKIDISKLKHYEPNIVIYDTSIFDDENNDDDDIIKYPDDKLKD